ncbi:hypothetical protein CXB51_004825 [Gossypium anomalum]|uniref:Uncharacterized protein n=1 Tax=Gossypium anomalum TaxID=47600 RepID=A0A8J6D835_9ROSI|nr:hypothetical protein CXB51_004825 [Gossypium anomalum]
MTKICIVWMVEMNTFFDFTNVVMFDLQFNMLLLHSLQNIRLTPNKSAVLKLVVRL